MDEGRLVIEAEGGDLGIEGEEDVGAAGERESKVVAVEPEIVTVVVEKKVKKSKKAAVEVVEAVEGDETMQDIPTEVIDPVQKKKGRREKKEEKRNAANGTVAVAEEKVAEGWAGDDEFFA
jgi:5-deoxy-D-glucuronate isomerase